MITMMTAKSLVLDTIDGYDYTVKYRQTLTGYSYTEHEYNTKEKDVNITNLRIIGDVKVRLEDGRFVVNSNISSTR